MFFNLIIVNKIQLLYFLLRFNNSGVDVLQTYLYLEFGHIRSAFLNALTGS